MRFSNGNDKGVKLIEQLRPILRRIRRERLSGELNQCFVSASVLFGLRINELMAGNNTP